MRGDRPGRLAVRRVARDAGACTAVRGLAVEAIVLAGGKAERLGEAAGGKPKALVRIAGHPLAAYQLAWLADAGVDRVIVACAAGQEELFHAELGGAAAELEIVGEPEPLGRGGGLRFAARRREESGPLYALNGDELLDVDLRALVESHRAREAAATVVVAQVRSPFGVVEVDDDDTIRGFREAPLLEEWVNAGVYVLDDEAIERLPERGDHEQTTFPELAAEGKLRAFRHTGTWLTVNTPKDLRRANEFFEQHPELEPVVPRQA